MKAQRILITGGLGYIGGRVAGYLKENHPECSLILTTLGQVPSPPAWARDFTLTAMDVCNEKEVSACLDNRHIDTIIHLAALNEIASLENPAAALQVNTGGTYTLLQCAVEAGVGRCIYFSTFHVYGCGRDVEITENTPTRPFHPYAYTHRAAEDVLSYFHHYKGMDTLIVRLSNGYGHPMDLQVDRWSLVFNDLCRQAAGTGRLVLKSSGRQHRDFISLHDIARAMEHFLFTLPQQGNSRWNDEVYNLGGGCSMSILDVAQEVARVYEKTYGRPIGAIEKKADGRSEDKVFPVRYNIDKLLATGFRLKGDMENEIVKTLQLCEGFAPKGEDCA